MSEAKVHVEIDMLTFRVDLPEEIVDDGEGHPTDEARRRAIEAALCALPQEIEVYIDGEDKPPARVFVDAMESGEDQVWCE